MSIASEIQRLQQAKSCIKCAIESKGVTVPSDLKLQGYNECINNINTTRGKAGLLNEYIDVWFNRNDYYQYALFRGFIIDGTYYLFGGYTTYNSSCDKIHGVVYKYCNGAYCKFSATANVSYTSSEKLMPKCIFRSGNVINYGMSTNSSTVQDTIVYNLKTDAVTITSGDDLARGTDISCDYIDEATGGYITNCNLYIKRTSIK